MGMNINRYWDEALLSMKKIHADESCAGSHLKFVLPSVLNVHGVFPDTLFNVFLL